MLAQAGYVARTEAGTSMQFLADEVIE